MSSVDMSRAQYAVLWDVDGAGVTLVSCRESFDTSTPTGQFVLTIIAGLAQMERDLASARTKAALAIKGRLTGDKGGSVPYGYQRAGDGVVIDEYEASAVRAIFALRRKRLTLEQIAAVMGADGYTSPRGKEWWASSVRAVLSNEPAYRGGKRGASDLHWPKVIGLNR
jgi:DNA invertase Pin-like site-specific DNA recombinase